MSILRSIREIVFPFTLVNIDMYEYLIQFHTDRYQTGAPEKVEHLTEEIVALRAEVEFRREQVGLYMETINDMKAQMNLSVNENVINI